MSAKTETVEVTSVDLVTPAGKSAGTVDLLASVFGG